MTAKDINGAYLISDALWRQIETLLPPIPPRLREERSRIDDRQAMMAMLYVLRTSCKWEELPSRFGAANELYDRFQEWQKTGVFDRMWQTGILTYDESQTLVRRGK
ncbi:transposase [Candidatus Poribacteria bacterium]